MVNKTLQFGSFFFSFFFGQGGGSLHPDWCFCLSWVVFLWYIPLLHCALLPCVITWKAQVYDRRGALVTFWKWAAFVPLVVAFATALSERYINGHNQKNGCLPSNQHAFLYIWFYPQLRQRRWCVISVEQRSPQRMLWKPTGKHTQVHSLLLTHTRSLCLTWGACIELLSKQGLRGRHHRF